MVRLNLSIFQGVQPMPRSQLTSRNTRDSQNDAGTCSNQVSSQLARPCAMAHELHNQSTAIQIVPLRNNRILTQASPVKTGGAFLRA